MQSQPLRVLPSPLFCFFLQAHPPSLSGCSQPGFSECGQQSGDRVSSATGESPHGSNFSLPWPPAAADSEPQGRYMFFLGLDWITAWTCSSSDFVCVLDMGVVELVLKLCQNSEEKDDLPQVRNPLRDVIQEIRSIQNCHCCKAGLYIYSFCSGKRLHKFDDCG